MPIRCETTDGLTVQASDCDTAQWQALRERNRAERNLSMPCCGTGAVLKTSRRGTRFFGSVAEKGEMTP